MSYFPKQEIQFSKSSLTDLLGSLRTVERNIIFESRLPDKDSENIDWVTTRKGTHFSSDDSSNLYSIKIGTAQGDSCLFRTRRIFSLPACSSRQVILAGVLGDLTHGSIRRIGVFSEHNGIFIEANSNSSYRVGYKFYKNGKVNVIYYDQKSWKFDDTVDSFDGEGPSESKIDFSKLQTFVFEYSWSSHTRIGYYCNGEIKYFLEFENTEVFSSPSLPCSIALFNMNGTESITEVKILYCSVILDGYYTQTGYLRSIYKDNLNNESLSVRIKKKYNGYSFNLYSLEIYSDTKMPIPYEIALNSVLIEPSWKDVPGSLLSEYSSEGDSHDGEVLYSGFIDPAYAVCRINLKDVFSERTNIYGNSDIITIRSKSNFQVRLNYREVL